MPIEIPLSRGFVAVVDANDADLAQRKWVCLNGKYAKASGEGGELMHRIIYERISGIALNKGQYIDHIDGDGLNNTRENLRLVTNAENLKNRKRHSNNKSGYKGVVAQDGKYRAKITVNGKRISLGMYDTPEEAHEAYKAAAIKYHGEFARFE